MGVADRSNVRCALAAVQCAMALLPTRWSGTADTVRLLSLLVRACEVQECGG